MGRGDFDVGTNAIVSRVAGLARVRSPFGYIEAYAAGSCDCHCHCANAGVTSVVEMAMAATNSLDLVVVSLLPGRPPQRAADMERERADFPAAHSRRVITIRRSGREFSS
jgi:hypothetical protein